MKQQLVLVAAVAAMMTGACSYASPGAGTEAVLVEQPLFAGHGGVEDSPIKTGLTLTAFTTNAVYVNMQPERVDMSFDDMMTASGVPVDFHVVLSMKCTDSVKLVRSFGSDGKIASVFTNNLEQPIRTAVRDAVKKHGMQEMAITAQAVDQVQAEVRQAADKLITASGVPLVITELNVGRVNPPDAVKHQRIETAAQEQRQISEQQRKLAEDQRRMAEESRAAADNAYNVKMQLTPDQYLRLETIKMQRDVCAKGGCYFGFTPMLTQGVAH